MKINFRKLIVSILIPLLLGLLVSILTSSSMYNEIIKPSFAPSGVVFPIVWTILYILMGISSYIIMESNNINKDRSLLIYYIQLIVNLLWSFFFFTFKLFLFSTIWISLLIILVILMIYNFYKISKLSAYLQIPYLIWLIIALILNYNIYLLN